MPPSAPPARLAAWTTRLGNITDEVQSLIHDRDTWHTISEIGAASPTVVANPFVMGHFNTLYYRRALVSVRAMADPSNDSDSLLTLLTDIAAHPGDLETTDSEMRLPGTDTIDPDKVLVDIERLKTVAATTKKYVTKRVAHIDRKGASRRAGAGPACPRFLAQGPQRLRAQGWGLKMLSAERLERILGCPCGWRGGPVRCEAPPGAEISLTFLGRPGGEPQAPLLCGACTVASEDSGGAGVRGTLSAWNGSWNGRPRNSSGISASVAIRRAVYAGSGYAAYAHASRNDSIGHRFRPGQLKPQWPDACHLVAR